MNPLDEIEVRLSKYPHVAFDRSQNELVVKAVDDSGFDVGCIANGPNYTVYFEGWHEDFEAVGEALKCFAFGLSDQCRLVVTYRGDAAVAWTVQARDGTEWRDDSTSGLFLVPFWRPRRVLHKRNHVMTVNAPDR